jgi:hypothetical protein
LKVGRIGCPETSGTASQCWVTSKKIEDLIYTAAQAGNYQAVIDCIEQWINIEYDLLYKHDGIKSVD